MKKQFDGKIGDTVSKMENFFLTSGYSFDGKEIKKYCSPVAGESLAGSFVTALLTPVGKYDAYTDATGQLDGFDVARYAAIDRMISKAKKFAANGIIGLRFQYVPVGKDGLLVMVEGTAVQIDA